MTGQEAVRDFVKRCAMVMGEVLPGAWIFGRAPTGPVIHHAICIRDSEVVHIIPWRDVESCTLQEFVRDWPTWSVNSYPSSDDHAMEVQRRARQCLEKNSNYNLLWNNCEQFAGYCFTGSSFDPGVQVVYSAVGGTVKLEVQLALQVLQALLLWEKELLLAQDLLLPEREV